MNKKGTKKLSGALAATTVLTSVAGATPAFAKGTDWDAIYKTAYEAMVKAEKEKTQESINAARKAIGDLAKNKQLFTMASTFSEKVDAVQQGLFNDLYALMYVDGKPKKSMTQEEINKAKALVTSFATYDGNKAYIASWSSAIDVYQQEHIVTANRAVEKAITTENEKDIQAARKEVKALATSGDEIVKKESARLDKQLSKVEAPVAVKALKDIKINELTEAKISEAKAQIKNAKELVAKLEDKKAQEKLNAEIKTVEEAVNEKDTELQEAKQALKVNKVEAIHADEIQVTFNKAVDKVSALDLNNYAITINNNRFGKDADANKEISEIVQDDIYHKNLSLDQKVVTFKLRHALDNGDRYGVDVKDAVLDKAKKEKGVKYETKTQLEFRDNDAPVLKSVSASGKLKLTFNEPISTKVNSKFANNEVFKVTIDGEVVEMDDPSTNVLNYSISSKDTLNKEFLEEGTHTVVIYNTRDMVENNGNGGNRAAILETTYTLTKAKEPVVKDVVQKETEEATEDFNTIRVHFDQAVTDANVIVKKGNAEFANAKNVSAQGIDEIGYFADIDLPITVQSNDVKGLTHLYEKDATSTKVNVVVKDYKNDEDMLGKVYTERTLELKKDSKVPTVESITKNAIKDNTLQIVLNRKDVKLLDQDKITVEDKNGISRAIDTAEIVELNNKSVVKLTLKNVKDKAELEKLAKFTVKFAKDALSVKTDKVDIESPKEDGNFNIGDMTNELKNKSFSTEVLKESEYSYKAVEGVEKVEYKNDKDNKENANFIIVTYKNPMTKTATEVSNYTLDKKSMPAGTKITMDGTNKIVTIILPKDCFNKDMKKKLVISTNVTTENGSYIVGNLSTKESYMSDLIQFKDNTQPVLKEAKFVLNDVEKDKTTNKIRVTFDEKVNGNADAKNFVVIAHDGTIIKTTAEHADGSSKNVVLTLEKEINIGQRAEVRVVPKSESKVEQTMTDANGNAIKENAKVTVAGKVQTGSDAQ